VTLWLVYILTEQDHRMNHVRDWVNAKRQALEKLIQQKIRETDFTDDRLAEVLSYLSGNSVWHPIEAGVSKQSIRVYDLDEATVRLDATVGQVYHEAKESELFKIGRTKLGTYDTQFKIMLGSLDPMGMLVAVDVVSGAESDDTQYIPVYERIRKTLQKSGLLYVGDSKMGALESRATIAANQDFYLMPLAMIGDTPDLLDGELKRLESGEAQSVAIYHPADLPKDPEQQPDPSLALARGFERSIDRICEVDGKTIQWSERLLIVQSEACVTAQVNAFDQRIIRAEKALKDPSLGAGKINTRRKLHYMWPSIQS
jgi:transposase